MHERDHPREPGNLVVVVGADLAGCGLAFARHVDVARDDERGAAYRHGTVEVEDLIRDETICVGTGFGRGRLDQTTRKRQFADPDGCEEHAGVGRHSYFPFGRALSVAPRHTGAYRTKGRASTRRLANVV